MELPQTTSRNGKARAKVLEEGHNNLIAAYSQGTTSPVVVNAATEQSRSPPRLVFSAEPLRPSSTSRFQTTTHSLELRRFAGSVI
jgi:hypothetical protein